MSITYIFGSLTKPFMRHHKFGNQKSAFQLCKAPIKFSIFQALSASLTLRLQGVLCIPIRPHPAFIPVIADLAGHYHNQSADPDGLSPKDPKYINVKYKRFLIGENTLVAFPPIVNFFVINIIGKHPKHGSRVNQ